MSDLPRGFNCLKCGEWKAFPAYVYAHWREELLHTCPKCKQRHSVICGAAQKVDES